jgi:hypothetical protein
MNLRITNNMRCKFEKYCGETTGDGCIEWTGPVCLSRPGYPRPICYCFNRQTPAARIAWVLHFGVIPTTMRVLRICTNNMCVNWEHLILERAGYHEAFADRGSLVNKGAAAVQ